MSEKAERIGLSTAQHIIELYETYCKLLELENEKPNEDHEVDGYTESYEVSDHACEKVLNYSVRSAWECPNPAGLQPAEFQILLMWGGPALRIIGEFDEYGTPINPRMQTQDWGTPWTDCWFNELDDKDHQEALQWFVELFYWGC